MKSKWILLLPFFGFMVLIGFNGEVLSAGNNFPTKPIQLYVGWGAGGGTSMYARVISQRAGEILGQPMVVMPKPGAGGTICNDYVRRSNPDGYTLTVATLPNNGTTLLIQKIPYTIDDFEYFGKFAINHMILLVSSKSPWKTLEELIAYAKEHPKELKYTSNGIGSSAHIAMELFNYAANIQTVHIPMKSDAEMLSSLLGGHCQLIMGFMSTALPVMEGGKVRFLATASEQRVKLYPDTPTFREKGLQFVYTPWYGIAGPKGIPKEVSDKLKNAFSNTFQDEGVHGMLRQFGITPDYQPAEEFTKFVHSEFKRFEEIFKKIGLYQSIK